MELVREAHRLLDEPVSKPAKYTRKANTDSPPPSFLAYEPSYPLYPYQRQSARILNGIYAGNNKANVLCASPTGSGKSFLIKYCAKLAVKHKCRLRVAVPLVALAEQQYADLCNLFRDTPTVDAMFEEFGGGSFDSFDDYYDEYCSGFCESEPVPVVGLWTGPTQVNEVDALICVCTYEIVTIQLDKNPHWMDDCPCLIVDEVHNLASERGHVVEAMMAHPNLRSNIVALSGTIPNAVELAENIGRVNQCSTHIVGASKRPITLQFHLDIGYQFRKVAHGNEIDETAWRKANEDLYTDTLPDRLGFNQLKTRLINMVYRLRDEEMLPAMCVAFSCNKLNRMADAVSTIDLLPEKKSKWKVRVLFKRLEARMGEDYVVVRELARLAEKGIVLHHSQLPKHYLETVCLMAQRNLAKIIFCTSTLSTGINLPVKTVVLTSSKRPSKDGMVWLSSALFFQICGRAGRPGCGEKVGLVVLCQWENSMEWKSIFNGKAEHVEGKGIVSPRTILQCATFASIDTEKVLCRSPFSTTDHSHLLGFYNRCVKALSDFPTTYVEQAKAKLRFVDKATACRGTIFGWVRNLRDGTEILVDAPFPRMHPYAWRFRAWVDRPRTFRVYESEEVCRSEWVLDVKKEIRSVVRMQEMFDLTEMRRHIDVVMEGPVETIPVCYDLVEATRDLKKKFFTPVFTAKYHHIVRRLREFKYLDGMRPTAKGKLVGALLAVEDPVCLVECWYRHILPRHDVHEFVSCLTCFLVEGRDGDPFNEFCQRVRQVSDEVDLCDQRPGSLYMAPVYAWSQGQSLAKAVGKGNVGHMAKTIQRLCQLLQQMEGASPDKEMSDLCTAGLTSVKRGLPFLKSMFL